MPLSVRNVTQVFQSPRQSFDIQYPVPVPSSRLEFGSNSNAARHAGSSPVADVERFETWAIQFRSGVLHILNK